MGNQRQTTYGDAILEAHRYLLSHYPDVFVIGQGLWSPWYVGNTMKDLDKEFGKGRVMDTPVSEDATTGIAVGASLCGYRPLVVHPRIDFMILATNSIVNQAAKWSHMLGGQGHPAVTVRGIINRGGEQGAQHSQSLHSWFSHIPGLRVVMPATVKDARNLLISSVLSPDPVIYMDDRWLYDLTDTLPPIEEIELDELGPQVLVEGKDITLVGSSYSSQLCQLAGEKLAKLGVSVEVIDLRVLNPLDCGPVIESVRKTGRLCAVDGSWRSCGLAGEVIAATSEKLPLKYWRALPRRLHLPDAPAPTCKVLEDLYYIKTEHIVSATLEMVST